MLKAKGKADSQQFRITKNASAFWIKDETFSLKFFVILIKTSRRLNLTG